MRGEIQRPMHAEGIATLRDSLRSVQLLSAGYRDSSRDIHESADVRHIELVIIWEHALIGSNAIQISH